MDAEMDKAFDALEAALQDAKSEGPPAAVVMVMVRRTFDDLHESARALTRIARALEGIEAALAPPSITGSTS